FMYTRPILVVPGIFGSLPSAGDFDEWIVQRGFNPEGLTDDPLASTYSDLIATLEHLGYSNGEDSDEPTTLFVANYDSRVPVAPRDDQVNGTFSEVTAESLLADIVGNDYSYGVDYLGYWLLKAATEFNRTYPGIPLDSVDFIGHSMGGLVGRAYVQSKA